MFSKSNKIINEKKIKKTNVFNDFNYKINNLERFNPIKDSNNFVNTKNDLENLKSDVENYIIDINNNFDSEEDNSEIVKSEILNLKFNSETEFLIQKYYYDKEYSNDPIYNEFKEIEKKELIKLFKENKKSIENVILDDNSINMLQNIPNKIIKKIAIVENSNNFFKNKIIKEIESIANDDKKYNINRLNILLVGRKGIGKSTLATYILDLPYDTAINNNDDFKEYTSEKVRYFRLIKVKGIGYESDITTEETKKNIKNYIDDLINDNKINYNNIIHCIWFFVSGPRFQTPEKNLFYSLKEIYKDNIMPIILVYTDVEDTDDAEKMKEYIRKEKIDNSFIQVTAKDTTLINNTIKKSFGKEELIKTTLLKCTEALGSNMMKIMMYLISENIKEKLIEEKKTIMNQIMNKTKNDFLEYYDKYLEDGNFIQYIIDIFVKHLNQFYDMKYSIKNKSKNLIISSDFISTVENIYFFYKKNIKEIIVPIVEKKSEELLDVQAKIEKLKGNMNYFNRKIFSEFKNISEIFLKKNYFFIAQNYIINYIINQEDNIFSNFLELFFRELEEIIQSLCNIYDDSPDCVLIREYLELCFKKKVKAFTKNNIFLNNTNFIQEKIPKNFSHDNIVFSKKNNLCDQLLKYHMKNIDSLIFHKIQEIEFNQIKKTKLNEDWFILEENEWYFLNNNLKKKIESFLKYIEYQESSIVYGNNDKNFILLQTQIKNDLINFINGNISQYFRKIVSYYNNNKSIKNNNYIKEKILHKYLKVERDESIFSNNDYEDSEIERIIQNQDIELFYKNEINYCLNEYAKINNIKMITQVSIIVAGKAGVGKSTLINSLLKENLALEGVGNVVTLQTKSYTNKVIPFLKLIDTRGYELNQKFNPDKIKDEVLSYINKMRSQNNYNDFIQCIWFCVHTNEIDQSEIDALTELKNNINNIPLIIVFTKAKVQEKIKAMEHQIESLFNDAKFIFVLARETQYIKEKINLNELLKMTLESIKSNYKSDLFNIVKDEFKQKEENRLNEKISKIKINIINKLVEEFIINYTKVLSSEDFEEYIYNLIEKVIIAFQFKKEIKQKTKSLIQYTKNMIQQRIKLYVEFYSKIAQNYIDMIIITKSFEYLEMQVEIEKMYKSSIDFAYKKSREEFKDLISSFLKDNFYYVSQKYFIYRIIKDLLEVLSEKIGKNILEKMKKYLSGNEVIELYKNIYLKILEDFEKEIHQKYRNPKTGKIYDSNSYNFNNNINNSNNFNNNNNMNNRNNNNQFNNMNNNFNNQSNNNFNNFNNNNNPNNNFNNNMNINNNNFNNSSNNNLNTNLSMNMQNFNNNNNNQNNNMNSGNDLKVSKFII